MSQNEMNVSATGSLRDNKGKAPLSWIPFEVLREAAIGLWKCSTPGGGKYPPNNWKKGAPHSVPIDSLLRHAHKRADGQMNDDETGLRESVHILMNAIFLVYYELRYPHMNDLVPFENKEEVKK